MTITSVTNQSRLILSIFPGIDLLGRAFEEKGFCVVRGPDILWGGDVRDFHPPSGVFWGVIGGPPCQDFSAKRRVEPTGYGLEMRETDRRGVQIPTMADAQWSSAIEQTADKQLALFRPAKVADVGSKITVGTREMQVTDDLLVFKLLKQRFDSGAGIWPVSFKPQTLEMFDYEFTKME